MTLNLSFRRNFLEAKILDGLSLQFRFVAPFRSFIQSCNTTQKNIDFMFVSFKLKISNLASLLRTSKFFLTICQTFWWFHSPFSANREQFHWTWQVVWVCVARKASTHLAIVRCGRVLALQATSILMSNYKVIHPSNLSYSFFFLTIFLY